MAPGTITLLREPFQALWALIALSVGGTILRALIVEKAPRGRGSGNADMESAESFGLHDMLELLPQPSHHERQEAPAPDG